ncbi:MAG: DCC1-like thiol-disulfide oxidoreductase family protein [Planctomycetaceae bacterium]
MDELSKPVLYFDGVCGLCNRFVDFVLRHDRNQNVLLAPLQGETAGQQLLAEDRENLSSVVFQNHLGTFRHSSAVARLLWELGGIWTLLGWLLWLIPKPIRNWGYRVVARNRYRFFGKKETCRMPTPEERARFLP